MATASGNINIITTTISVNSGLVGNVTNPKTLYAQYLRGEFIEVFNSFYFKVDLSKIEDIINKPKPLFYGLSLFNRVTEIEEINIDNIQQPDTKNIYKFYDGGKAYDLYGGIAEKEDFVWGCRTLTEQNPYLERSDVDAFDYPEVAIRGTRKIPTGNGNLCGEYSTSINHRNYNWYFGHNSGINFNPIESGITPTTLSGTLYTLEGCSVMSDVNGELLFYSDGVSVYNKEHNVMSNGSGLGGFSSSTQSVLIVPRPTTNKFYVFTTNYDGATNGFKVSTVNMDLDGGLGQVEAKNLTLISTPVTEKVTATKHINGEDYWVITHTSGDSKYYSFKVTSSGVEKAVISDTGVTHNTLRGYMKTSIDGSKIVSAIYDEDIIEILDFDTSGGTMSNPLTISGMTFIAGPYGVEFSSDSSKLYITDGANTKIYQLDLSYDNANDMVENMIEVADISGSSLGSIQMAPDEKIYVADKDQNYLHVIHNPDGLGYNCNFEVSGFTLYSATTSQWGLPNCVTDTILSCDRYVYITDDLFEIYNFDLQINNNNNVIETKELNYYSEVYKFNKTSGVFNSDSVYTTDTIPFSTTTATTLTIPVNNIGEGEFIIKSYFEHPLYTLVNEGLGNRKDSINTYKTGKEYGLYDPRTDWYFINIFEADEPLLNTEVENGSVGGNLVVESTLSQEGVSAYTFSFGGDIMVSYNGSVLGKNYDYTISGSNINLNFEVLDGQVITVAYVSNGNRSLYLDSYKVSSINSGATDTQTINDKIYYNTTTSKYEYYLDSNTDGSVLLTINGAPLINGVEYYQSTTNKRRIIIENVVEVGDVITAVYFPNAGIVGNIFTLTPVFGWTIQNAPTDDFDGTFTVEIADEVDTNFDTILFSGTVDYQTGIIYYNTSVSINSVSFGDNFIYRIKNEKRYTPISGEVIKTITYSETLPITVITNEINSY